MQITITESNLRVALGILRAALAPSKNHDPKVVLKGLLIALGANTDEAERMIEKL